MLADIYNNYLHTHAHTHIHIYIYIYIHSHIYTLAYSVGLRSITNPSLFIPGPEIVTEFVSDMPYIG